MTEILYTSPKSNEAYLASDILGKQVIWDGFRVGITKSKGRPSVAAYVEISKGIFEGIVVTDHIKQLVQAHLSK